MISKSKVIGSKMSINPTTTNDTAIDDNTFRRALTLILLLGASTLLISCTPAESGGVCFPEDQCQPLGVSDNIMCVKSLSDNTSFNNEVVEAMNETKNRT